MIVEEIPAACRKASAHTGRPLATFPEDLPLTPYAGSAFGLLARGHTMKAMATLQSPPQGEGKRLTAASPETA